MLGLIKTIATGSVAFAATNVDGLFILMFFFSQVDEGFRSWKIVVGHYFGFAALVTLSILGSLGVLVISEQWIGLMGLVPIFLGVRALTRLREDTGEESKPVEVTGVYSVAAVTFTNGGDNIGIYVPIFASVGFTRVVTIILVFFALLTLWCYAGYKLGNHPTVADVINRYGHFIVPFVLVALGVYIIAESGILFFLYVPSS